MISFKHLLAQLNARIVSEQDGILTIQVLPDLSDATVQVNAADLRAWCEKRLATRAKHIGKCLRGGGSSPHSLAPRHIG